MESQALPIESTNRSPLAPAITIGFFASTLLWVFAWAIHVPHINLPVGVTITAMILTLLFVCLAWLPAVHESIRVQTGLIAGGIYGLINMLILGSFIAEQPESTAEMAEQANQLQPSAIPIIVGSLVGSVAIGCISGLIVRNSKRATAAPVAWIARFGWVTALSYLPLIAVGGLVTSTDSGLAVPDGVTSYGAVSVLFPLKLMGEPRIFFEHSHRLFGTLAGLTTMILMIRVLIASSSKLSKAFVIILFIGVVFQGIMGALRVSEESTALAIIHGILAQLVFALAVVSAISLSERFKSCAPKSGTLSLASKTRMMTGLTFGAIVFQLILGAVTRHLHSGHMMMAHMGFAFIVIALVIITGSFCIRMGKTDIECKKIRPFGGIMHGIVVLQFTLGFGVLGMAWDGEEAPDLATHETLATTPQTPIGEALITTSHHLIGALLLAAIAGALIWSLKLASRCKIG